MRVLFCVVTVESPELMEITDFNTTLIDLPLEKLIETAVHSMQSPGCVLLELETSDGYYLQAPDRPGTEFTFNVATIKRFRMN